MSVLQKKELDNVLTFTLKDVDVSIVNGLRREIISSINVVGIEEENIIIEINNSKIHNEMLKHRITCIPIHITDYASIDVSKYTFIIDIVNTSNTILDVTTEHIQLLDMNNKKVDTTTIFPIDPITKDHILITRLYPRNNSNLEHNKIVCKGNLSICNPNISSVYNCVSTCSYSNVIDPVEQNKKWNETLKTLDDKSNLDMMKKNWYLHEGKRYYKPNEFSFTVESIGIYTNTAIVEKACHSIIKKCNTLQNIKDNIKKGNTVLPSYEITIPNDNYTIGKIIESTMHTLYFKEKAILSFIGYNKPHPHDDYGIIRVMFHNDSHNEEMVRTLLQETVQASIQLYTTILKSFTTNS